MVREVMVIEAIERMKLLKMSKSCIKALKNGEVWMSENYGALYEIDDDFEDVLDEIKSVEEKYGCLVYHVIRNVTEFGDLFSFMYVTKYNEYWEEDKDELLTGYAFAYVYNRNIPEFSEFGGIQIKSCIGGLVRLL